MSSLKFAVVPKRCSQQSANYAASEPSEAPLEKAPKQCYRLTGNSAVLDLQFWEASKCQLQLQLQRTAECSEMH